MERNFEEKKRALRELYGSFTPEERRRILIKIRRKNLLQYHQLERIKHELLRCESKRVQLALEGNEKLSEQLEEKILKKKELFLKALSQNNK